MATKKKRISSSSSRSAEAPRDEQAIFPAVATLLEACATTVERIDSDDADRLRGAAKRVRRGTKRAHRIREAIMHAFGPIEDDEA